MAEEEQAVCELRDDFYRDGFSSLFTIIVLFAGVFACLLMLSLYFFLSKPAPVSFAVLENWRVQPAVPVDQPYRPLPEVLQWVSDTIPTVFQFDFNNYNTQLKDYEKYFTADGWKVFLNQLNNYVNFKTVQLGKAFVSGEVTSAPYLLRGGLLSGKYGWWVQMPIKLSTYALDHGEMTTNSQSLTLQILVVRTPTLTNLTGIAIDNVIVLTDQSAEKRAATTDTGKK